MKFVKQSFMGIELDILVGHPEHDILFIATQVARAAGLKDGKRLTQATKGADGAMQLRALASIVENLATIELHKTQGKRYKDSWLFPEHVTYQMLARGNAPQSQPFRDWVFKEVLPSIRKTGSYNVNESETPEAVQFSGELAQLHSALSELTSEVRSSRRYQPDTECGTPVAKNPHGLKRATRSARHASHIATRVYLIVALRPSQELAETLTTAVTPQNPSLEGTHTDH